MAQFYFLSIMLNILAGLILVYGKNYAAEVISEDDVTVIDESDGDDELSGETGASQLGLDTLSFRLITGILCVFVAFMKILSVFRGDIPVIGDLIPALAGLLAGASILLEYYIYSTQNELVLPENLQSVFLGKRKIIGFVCFGAAVLHFIFPQVMFL